MSESPSETNLLKSNESQISFKKHHKIKTEINTNRRQALKDFYKLQQEELQPIENSSIDSDEELEEEIRLGKPIPNINIHTSTFQEILKNVNKLSTSVNLINSDIKNIIYNNYYELIKLNEFLKDMGQEEIIIPMQHQDNKGLIDQLKKKNWNQNEEEINNDLNNLDQLQTLMDSIKHFNEKEKVRDKNDEKDLENSLKLMNLNNFEKINQKEKIIKSLSKTIEDVDDKEILTRQLKKIQEMMISSTNI